MLSAEDLALVRAKRRPSNRLGFAVQLCVLRHPGRPLDPSELPSPAMLAFAASQVGVDPKMFGEYAHRAETRREHLLELQHRLRLRSFRLADWRACVQVGANAAWATDRGEPIVQAMLAHLRADHVLIPAAAVLERIGLAARVRARKRVFQALAEGLTDGARDALEKLLALDPALRRSRFAWLRDCAESPAPSNILGLLDRLEFVRALGVDETRARRIHPARLGRLLAEAAVMTVQHIADLEPARRTAILVAQTADLETRLGDATLAMFEKYIGSLFSKAQNRDERRFQATKRDVAKALLLFRRTIAALKQAQATGEDGIAVVDREVGLKRLENALPIIDAVAETADQDILVTAAERYSAAPVQPTLSGGVPLRVERAARPGAGGDRGPQGDGPRRCPRAPEAPAGVVLAAEVAQADLRQRRGRPAAVRSRRARRVARAAARQRHLGRGQPRLPRL